MLFASLIFLFAFLPLTLIVYYSLKKYRYIQNVFLFIVSMFFYAWGEPKFSLILLFSILINWILAILIDFCKSIVVAKLFLWIGILLNLGLLFYNKYIDFMINQINTCFVSNIPLRNLTLPIGISFFTFQALSYLIDVYRGKRDGICIAQKNPIYVGLYIAFFPQLIAGPIVRYNSIEKQIKERKESWALFKSGSLRFMAGFSKKILLANTLGAIADKIFSIETSQLSISLAWLGAIAYTFQIYFDFSGYSDMAIGLGKIFGFTFEENFNLPYCSKSVTEFWRRWHISLSVWFRDYVYIPLGGNRCSSWRNIVNLFIVWLLTGFWHGANWTFVVWGLIYCILLIGEKHCLPKVFFEKHYILGHLYVWFVILLTWVVFRSSSLSFAFNYLSAMFCNNTVWQNLTMVLIYENIWFIIAATILSLKSFRNFGDIDNWWSVINNILILLFFVVSIVYLVNNSYNPFIYFNF